MLNKKGVFGKITDMTLLLIVLVIMISVIYNTLLGKDIAFANSQTEKFTIDCDEDNSIGLNDDCPCDSDIVKLPKEAKKCPDKIDEGAMKACPKLCKKK